MMFYFGFIFLYWRSLLLTINVCRLFMSTGAMVKRKVLFPVFLLQGIFLFTLYTVYLQSNRLLQTPFLLLSGSNCTSGKGGKNFVFLFVVSSDQVLLSYTRTYILNKKKIKHPDSVVEMNRQVIKDHVDVLQCQIYIRPYQFLDNRLGNLAHC